MVITTVQLNYLKNKKTRKKSGNVRKGRRIQGEKRANQRRSCRWKSSYATVGAKTSVNNIDYFKNELKELVKANEKAKAYNKTKPAIKARTFGASITKLKNKIATLEQMKEADENKVMSEKTKELIESGAVTQWKKNQYSISLKG